MTIKNIVEDYYGSDSKKIGLFLEDFNSRGYELVASVQVGLLGHFLYFFKKEEE